MVAHLVDVSRWQVELPSPLSLTAARQSGFTVANIALTGGRGYVSGTWAASFTTAAKLLGMDVSFYHWLDGRTSGTAQATAAVNRMRQLYGGTTGFAHVVDIEESGASGITPPTYQHVADYVRTARRLLGRPIAIYTGDWYWRPRKWDGASLTPYLHAAPNAGYLNAYPGDTSGHWTAGYGGWSNLAIMQYRTATIAGVNTSQSAIRDPRIWAALTGEETGMSVAPPSMMEARQVFRDETDLTPVELGIVGDAAHADGGDSYHLGKDQLRASASYSVRESKRDNNPTNAASALDIGMFSPLKYGGKTHTLRTFSTWLVGECKADAPDTRWIREVIYSPDGKVVKRWDRLGIRSTGDSSHLGHTHVSGFRDSEKADRAAIFRRYFDTIKGANMPITGDDAEMVWARDTIPNPGARADSPRHDPPGTNENTTARFALGNMWERICDMQAAVTSLAARVNTMQSGLNAVGPMVAQTRDSVSALAQQLAAHETASLDRSQAEIGGAMQGLAEIRELLDQLREAGADPVTVNELEQAFRNVLRDGTGGAES